MEVSILLNDQNVTVVSVYRDELHHNACLMICIK